MENEDDRIDSNLHLTWNGVLQRLLCYAHQERYFVLRALRIRTMEKSWQRRREEEEERFSFSFFHFDLTDRIDRVHNI